MSDRTPAKVSEISVVVPVRNEAASIQQLIEDLMSQTRLPAEIVITDGGSTDETPDIVERLIAAGAPAKLLREPHALPGRGRNVGVSNSRGDWIAFIDGGIRPEPDWLEKLAEAAARNAADVVFGSYQPVTDTFFAECAAIAYVAAPQEIDGRLGRFQFIASTLIHRKVFETVGGFPEDLRSAEDLLWMRRVIASDFAVACAPEAIVHWRLQPNLGSTFKRFATYARNNIRAGLFGEWQGRIFVYYALIAAAAAGFFIFGPGTLAGPPLLWFLMLSVRALKALYVNRQAFPASVVRNSFRFLLVVPILAVLDAATFVGSLDWLLRDKLRWLKSE
jgi:glycosyltransferase involved in cell wall biosynthesis